MTVIANLKNFRVTDLCVAVTYLSFKSKSASWPQSATQAVAELLFYYYFLLFRNGRPSD